VNYPLYAVSSLLLFGNWHWNARAKLPLPRAAFASGAVDHCVIVAGGSFWDGGVKRRTARVDIYDMARERWREGPPLPSVRSDAASVSQAGVLYVVGGADGARVLDSVLAYRFGSWEQRGQLQLPEPRMRGAAAVDGRRLYYVGGMVRLDEPGSASAQAWSIDLAEPSAGWQRLPDLPAGPVFLEMAVAEGGRLHVLGGARLVGDSVTSLSDVWSLDVAAGRWWRRPSLPTPLRAAWAASDHGAVFLFGGFSSEFSAQITAFDPRTGLSWNVGRLPEPVADAPFIRVAGGWLGTGGEIGAGVRASSTWWTSDRRRRRAAARRPRI
jgi:N-acetylneuraminic acid mutarotase